ncbi:hypothetical protein D3C84_1257690 [compost metagenome]
MLAPHEAAEHPHLVARDTYFTRDNLLQTRVAPRFNGEVVTPGEVPEVGEHTGQILAALDAKASVWHSS